MANIHNGGGKKSVGDYPEIILSPDRETVCQTKYR